MLGIYVNRKKGGASSMTGMDSFYTASLGCLNLFLNRQNKGSFASIINRDSIRKAGQAFLIQKGRTIDPDGLNIREETY